MFIHSKILMAGLVLGAAIFCFSDSFAQTLSRTTISTKSAGDTYGYVGSGGFRNYELGSTDDNIEDVLDLIYNDKGELFAENVTLYTEAQKFSGTVIQVTNQYVVVLDQTRISARETRVNAMHVIERDEIIGVTAKVLP